MMLRKIIEVRQFKLNYVIRSQWQIKNVAEITKIIILNFMCLTSKLMKSKIGWKNCNLWFSYI